MVGIKNPQALARGFCFYSFDLPELSLLLDELLELSGLLDPSDLLELSEELELL